MAFNYGILKSNPTNDKQPFAGDIACPVFRGKVTLAVNQNRGTNADAPNFEVNSNGFQIGNAWIKRGKNGDFLSITLDGPHFDKPLYLTAFERQNEVGTYDVVWSRPKQATQPVDNGSMAA